MCVEDAWADDSWCPGTVGLELGCRALRAANVRPASGHGDLRNRYKLRQSKVLAPMACFLGWVLHSAQCTALRVGMLSGMLCCAVHAAHHTAGLLLPIKPITVAASCRLVQQVSAPAVDRDMI